MFKKFLADNIFLFGLKNYFLSGVGDSGKKFEILSPIALKIFY
jgi:hypothetical protein